MTTAPTVVLVNYNSGSDLTRCIDALESQTCRPAVTVVDNASSDGSLGMAYERFPHHRFLPFRRNVGFARAVNLAARQVDSELMVVLNPDTVPQPDFIEAIAEPFSTQPTLASVAGALVFASDPSITASAGIRIHRNGVAIDAELGKPVRELVPRPIFGASGGAACYRRSAFLEAGGFPEVFFMYLEDVDLAWRLRLIGYESLFEPSAIATHRYSGASSEGSPLKRRLLARNRIWTLVRCLPDELWRRDWPRIISFDGAALSYGLIRDRQAAIGRLEALGRLAPRLCERRAIQRMRLVEIAALEPWIEAPISGAELRRLRELTSRLAV